LDATLFINFKVKVERIFIFFVFDGFIFGDKKQKK